MKAKSRPKQRKARAVQARRRGPSPGPGAGPRGSAKQPDKLLLETVSVPPQFEPIFLKAQEYVRRYFADRVEKPEQSTISISGERYILIRAASMSVEFFDLVMSLYRDKETDAAREVANNILFDLAHALGRADARSFGQKMGVTDPLEKLSAGPIHFAFAGWAFVKILPESNPVPNDDFLLLYDHPFSFESDAWLTRGRKSIAPVCIMNSGYSSGWCQESFGLSLVTTEIECLVAGGEQCRFIMAPPGRIEEHLERYRVGRTGFSRSSRTPLRVTVPEFFQRKRLEDELRKHHENLERRVEARTSELLRTNELLRSEIAERKRTEQQLRLLGSAVQNADEGIVILGTAPDADGPRIVFVNQGFVRTTGLSSDQAVGNTLHVIDIDPNDHVAAAALTDHLAEGKAFRGEMLARRKGSVTYSLELHVMPISDMVEGLTHWIAILRDVSERKSQLDALERQALYDALTDLPNRVLLQDRLEQALFAAGRTKSPLALLFMDLDRFKEVNDTFGHHCGDQLLRLVGDRLRAELRASDSISRLGGDEFAVLLPVLEGASGAVLTAQKILRSLEEPFVVEGQLLDVGASIGIALHPEHGTDAATLMRRADVAMYVAKQSGSGYAVYDPELDPHSARRLVLMGELKVALDQSQLKLQYQPIVHLGEGYVDRLEALVCWEHPQHGLLLRSEFVTLAERSGLVKPLTDYVLALACRQCQAWHEEGLPIGIAVNVSARNLQDPQFPQRIASVLKASGLEPRWLTLEITESSIVADTLHPVKLLKELRVMGLSLAIDDFGTGYSSLTHLKQLPLNEIKVDRSFIRDIVRSDSDAAIVRSTIEMSHNFGYEVVAVGVEDDATCRFLTRLGCDMAQGTHFGPPMGPGDVGRWIEASGRELKRRGEARAGS